MKVAVVGSGYVGLVAGACFADAGNHVTSVDCNAAKIEGLKRGEIPIYEPGLSEMILRNGKAGRLEFTTDLATAVRDNDVIFIAVGTPPAADGSADLSAILSVASEIGSAMESHRIIVMKSTVPVGTHQRVSEAVASKTRQPFDYVSNPEFLKEGAAIQDFVSPDRVVLGCNNPDAINTVKKLYAPFMRKGERILTMSAASAEMTKYAANAMLATRISFMNEVATLCDHYGASVEEVRRGIGSDSRIGSAFLFPGVGYGGSCFPKDVTAFMSMGTAVGFELQIATAVHRVNQDQRQRFADRVVQWFGDQSPTTTLAVWGLAFKARTDDVREAPAIAAIRRFREAGFTVQAHDPEANGTATDELGGDLRTFDDGYAALVGADALVVFTDWPEFRTPDFDAIGTQLRQKLIFDGRNLYDGQALADLGFTYVSIGRPVARPGVG